MLGFLTSGIGKYALIAVAAIALVGFVYAKGYGAASDKCQREALEAALAAAQLQQQIAEDIAAGDREALVEVQELNRANEVIINDFEIALADNACLAGAPDIEFLRRFRP
jgi:hypothetical protein